MSVAGSMLLIAGVCSANGAEPALRFDSASRFYELQAAAPEPAEELTFEAWLTIDPACPDGARVFDNWAPGSQEGCRLEVGPGGTLRFVTTAPDPALTETKLPCERITHIAAVFSPRGLAANVYVDGKLAGKVAGGSRWVVPRTTIPLRIGADQVGGNRFVGSISRVAVYSRALTAAEVARPLDQRAGLSNLVGQWQLAAGAGSIIKAAAGDAALVAPVAIEPLATPMAGDLTLWYPQPAREWVEALPVGNGRLGAMVFGGVQQERLQLNEDTIWTGGPYDPVNPAAAGALTKVRELVFAGKQAQAEELISQSVMAVPLRQAAYSTLGNLVLTFGSDRAPASEYRRSLDLNTAIATTTVKRAGVVFTREVFSSAADQVIVVRLTASRPGSIQFGATMNTPQRPAEVTVESGRLKLAATSGRHGPNAGQVRFESQVEVRHDGGSVSAGPQSITVAGADSATLLIACGTSYVDWQDATADASLRCRRDLRAAAGLEYEQLRARHLADYQALFNRVTIDLGRGEHAGLPTDERVRQYGSGNDPGLAALFYQYGRYLLISSSRPGCQPANLQGLWNDSTSPPWGGKYTININTEMNYWPAEPANLSECAEPLFQLIREIAQSGRRTAQTMYGARGWVCHHNTDLWRATAPIDGPGYGMWPMGGAWLATHLWDHYLFTGDKQFLTNAYPILKGACEFFLDTLVEEPGHKWLVTCPSLSPEHGGVAAGPAMDSQILRDLFAQTACAAGLLGRDEDFRADLLRTRERLAPHQIGKHGQLQEWLEDKDREKDSHRHPSHLYALFPSAQINPESAGLFRAAVKSLEGRGDTGTGWALAWKINLWARALDGEHAYRLLTAQLTPPKGGSQGGGTYPNLFDAHPPFQIDGNFGATSGLTEMLLQSRALKSEISNLKFEIHLLPALPKAWPAGFATGLRARGGFEIDIAWKEGKLSSARILSLLGNPVRLRSGTAARDITLRPGEVFTWTGSGSSETRPRRTAPAGERPGIPGEG